MMGKRPRLTDRDWQTIRMALNDAADERDSFADAYSYKGPEAEKALDQVKRYRDLNAKLFGDKLLRDQMADEFAAMPTLSINEISRANRGGKGAE